MRSELRRVGKLRLHAAEDSLNRRGAVLIEDALRTASLPGDDSSTLLVLRALRLGRLDAAASPASVALRIEARCRDLAPHAVHAESPEAAAADAVYFRDDGEPYAALALRLALGGDATAWYWPLAIRGWKPTSSRDEALRMALLGAVRGSTGAAGGLALLRRLWRHGALKPLLAALRPQDGAGLLQGFGWIRPPGRAAPDLDHAAAEAPARLAAEWAGEWIASWGDGDDRSLWLGCVALCLDQPVLAARADLPQRAAHWLAAAEPFRTRPPRALASGRAVALGLQFDAEPTLEPATAPPTLAPGECGTDGESAGAAPLREGAPRQAGLQTRYAGLFHLVAVLERLGIEEWIASHPGTAPGFPAMVLRLAALQLGATAEDAALLALGELAEGSPPQEAGLWARTAARWLRRRAGLRLRRVICRAGRISSTETHVDVVFPLADIDIRVRRAGLDLDPGWVPWLGKVIRFHYREADDGV